MATTTPPSEIQQAQDAQWTLVLAQRDALLLQSDWIVIRALEQKAQVPAAWADYRQALRDITDFLNPFFIDWPTAPADPSTTSVRTYATAPPGTTPVLPRNAKAPKKKGTP